jgi:hypothetical protein
LHVCREDALIAQSYYNEDGTKHPADAKDDATEPEDVKAFTCGKIVKESSVDKKWKKERASCRAMSFGLGRPSP